MNKNTIIWIVSAIIVIVMGIYLFATKNQTEENVTIIHWNVDSNPMRQTTIPAFETLNPNIKVIHDPNCDISTVMTQIAGGVAPDIITCYTAENFRKMAKLGQLEDLTPYIKKYNMPVDKIRPSLKDFVYLKDDNTKVYGIPENGGPFIVFYNKNLFDKYNVPYPTNDWTWDDMIEKGKLLTKYKKVNGRNVADIKGLYVWPELEFFVHMYGGRIYSSDGKKCTINEPNSLKGMLYWEKIRLKDKIIPSTSEESSMATTGTGGSALLMAQNKVAMTVVGRWEVTTYRDYYKKGIRLGMVPFPKAPYQNNVQLSKTYCIPKIAKHKEEAAKFLAYILSTPNQILVTDYGDGWGVINNPEIEKSAIFNPKYPQEDNNKALLEDFDNAELNELSPYISDVDFQTIYNYEIGKVWLGEQNMKTACKNIEERVNKTINRNINNPNFL